MSKKKTILITILCLIGLALTCELAYIFYKVNFNIGGNPSFCSVNSLIDCDGVAGTNYSMFLGIPLALWGMFLYFAILILTYVDKITKKFPGSIFAVFKNPSSYIAALGLLSFTISMILAGISIFTIKKICVLCFVTYFIDLFIAITARGFEGFIKDIKNTLSDFIDGVKKYTALFILVVIAAIAVLSYTQTSLVFSPNQRDMKSFETFRKMEKNIYAVSGNTLGNSKGEIKVVVYSDFMCPFCKITNIMAHKLAKEEKVTDIEHVNFPLDMECNPILRQSIHPGSCIIARYALAAKKQNKYWDLTNAIYDNQPSSEEELWNMAHNIGVNVDQLREDAYSQQIRDELNSQIIRASKMGVQGTPTIEIDGITYPGAVPYYKMKTYVKQALKRHKEGKM